MARKKKYGLDEAGSANGLVELAFHESSVPQEVMDAIRDSLAGLRFGQVTIVVHNSEVVQIDRTERRRLV